MPATSPAVLPATGPSARLSLNDPTSQYLIASILAVVGAAVAVTQNSTPDARLVLVSAVAHLTVVAYGIFSAKHQLQGEVIKASVSQALSYLPEALHTLAPVIPAEVAKDAQAAADILSPPPYVPDLSLLTITKPGPASPASEAVPEQPPAEPVTAPVDVAVDPPLGPPPAAPEPPGAAPEPTPAAPVAPPAPAAPTWSVVDANGVLVGHIDPSNPTVVIPTGEGH